MKSWLRDGLIGLGIWLIFTLVFLFVGFDYACISSGISGPCYSPLQDSLKNINDYVAFPFLISAYSPVYNYWSFVFFFIWGALIGWIIRKFKSRK